MGAAVKPLNRVSKRKPTARATNKKTRSLEEIQFLDMAVERLKAMPPGEYKMASEKLEIIGTKKENELIMARPHNNLRPWLAG